MANKPKKPKNLNELLEQLRRENSSNLDESFKAHDAFTKDEYQNHLYNNIFVPAQHELYKGVKEELENVLGDDDTKLEHKNKELKKVVGKGLRKYFEKVMPGVIKAADALGMTEEQQYEHFSSLYDEHTAAGTQMGQRLGVKSISDLVDLAKDKKATVGKLKKSLYEMQEKHVQGALVKIGNQHVSHHFGSYHGSEIAAYLKPKLEGAGFEVDDVVAFARGDLGDMLRMRDAYLEKKEHPYLKKKEEKKK